MEDEVYGLKDFSGFLKNSRKIISQKDFQGSSKKIHLEKPLKTSKSLKLKMNV